VLAKEEHQLLEHAWAIKAFKQVEEALLKSNLATARMNKETLEDPH
jgi:hypothetical protein